MSSQNNNESDEICEMDAWLEKEHQQLMEDYVKLQSIKLNTLEIQRLPEGLKDTGLGAIVAGTTKIAPLSVGVCFKDGDNRKTVGLVTFRTHKEATRAIERLRTSDMCENWRMCLIANPEKK